MALAQCQTHSRLDRAEQSLIGRSSLWILRRRHMAWLAGYSGVLRHQYILVLQQTASPRIV